jgi:hypothetical protein
VWWLMEQGDINDAAELRVVSYLVPRRWSA